MLFNNFIDKFSQLPPLGILGAVEGKEEEMKKAKPFTMDQTWLQCIGCGHKTDLLKEREFRCPQCGDLYDVMHNFDLFPAPPAGYRICFDNRAATNNHAWAHLPYISSGVWRFREWIMPYLPDEMIVTLGEGNVPIVRAGRKLMEWIGADIDLWMILEGVNPTGSFKDHGGTVMISVAKAAGIKAAVCASTGDTSAMLAAYAAAAGMVCAVILPKGKVTPVQLAQPLVHSAKVITLPGNFDDCMRVMQELVKIGVYPANSLNPTRIEGHQSTVFLVAQFFDWKLPHWFAVVIGNGSNCSSIGKGLDLMNSFGFSPVSRILGCQSRAANPLAKSWNLANQRPGGTNLKKWQNEYVPIKVGETTATAARIGDPVSRDKVMRSIAFSKGAMQVAQERDLNEAVAVCGKDGHFICPQTGIALAGVRNAAKKKWIKPGERVVVVSTATGLKFTDSAAAHLQDRIIDADDCKVDTVARILGL